MHRSPLSVLVIFAALAACSTRDASAESELLAKDATLVARLAKSPAPASRGASLPDACGAVTTAARPAAANAAQAEELARRGYDAEALGDLQEARTLLGRASELDGTNESVAYHLGRAHEALGDRTAAVSAYCRFLALTPTTAESDEARQRVTRLSQPEPRVAAGGVSDDAPTRPRTRATPPRRVTRRRPAVAPRVVATATVERSPAAASRALSAPAPSAAADGGDASPARAPIADAPGGEGPSDRSAASGDVVAAGQEPTVTQPSTAARAGRGGLSRAQRAGIGAAAGAIIGAATGRSAKGALIGAAAGGVLGTAIGGGIGPAGRGIRPYQPYQPYRPYRP